MPGTPVFTQHVHETSSDYGSDPDEETLNTLYSAIPSDTIEIRKQRVIDIEDYEDPKGIKLPKVLGKAAWELAMQVNDAALLASTALDKEIRDNSGATAVEGSEEERRSRELAQIRSADLKEEPSLDDPRSPLERFRKPPRKALSVTDLVSPSWCELQYFYSLVQHGKKRRTPAMRQGSKVHKQLEDEIHVTVAIDVRTKEDAWGLRFWNIIQGLQTLRNTGVTRELEIWGMIDGELVNGIVDELTYICPDPAAAAQEKLVNKPGDQQPSLPEGQTRLTDFLLSSTGGKGKTFADLQAQSAETDAEFTDAKSADETDNRHIYLIDTKTRGFKSLPSGSSLRPTHIQLHLYHHMLTQLALGNLPLSSIIARNSLDPNRPFSDSFIAQICGLNEHISSQLSSQGIDNASQVPPLSLSSQDPLDILSRHNTLSTLWSLLLSSFRSTILRPSSSSASPPSSILSSLLTARYVSSSTGELIGNKTFSYDWDVLDLYLSDAMRWWRGERAAQGVEVQDAWKCRVCEFREGCEWIRERDSANVEGAIEKKRKKKSERSKGGKGIAAGQEEGWIGGEASGEESKCPSEIP